MRTTHLLAACSFDVSAQEIRAALESPELQPEPAPDVELPDHLVDPTLLQTAMEVSGVGAVWGGGRGGSRWGGEGRAVSAGRKRCCC